MIPPFLLVHTASLERYRGATGRGDRFDDPVDVPCYYEGRQALVRDTNGDEVTADGFVYADPTDVPVGSRITVLGRTAHAIAVSPHDDGGITGLAHVEIALA